MNKAIKIMRLITALLFILYFAMLPALAVDVGVPEPAEMGDMPGESSDAPDTDIMGDMEVEPSHESADITGTEPPDEGADITGSEPTDEGADITGTEPTDEGADITGTEPPDEGTDISETEPLYEGADISDSSPESQEDAADPSDEAENADDEILDVVVPITDVLNVVVPTTVSMTLDPLELSGRGQIYSDIYDIINLGDTDVVLTLTDIQVIFANDSDFEALAQPYDQASQSSLKAVFLVMDFGRAEVPPVVLTDTDREGPVSILLNSAQGGTEGISHLYLSFTGNLNENPAVPWVDGDIKIVITYSMENVSSSEEDNEESETTDAEAEAEAENDPTALDSEDKVSEEDATADDDTQSEIAEEAAPSSMPQDESDADNATPDPPAEVTIPDSELPDADSQVEGSSDKPPGDAVTGEPSSENITVGTIP
jgi:hypothetical protein